MTKQRDAYAACLVRSLGLTSRDLQEIGGFSDSFARAILRGAKRCPDDVVASLHEIDGDTSVISDDLIAQVQEGEGAIWVFKTNEALRSTFPQWPARGEAQGGFTGPHMVAALSAQDALDLEGIEVDILFFSG